MVHFDQSFATVKAVVLLLVKLSGIDLIGPLSGNVISHLSVTAGTYGSSLPSPRLVKILTGEFMNENLCNTKYRDLARSKSEALINMYILLKQNIKSCNAKR